MLSENMSVIFAPRQQHIVYDFAAFQYPLPVGVTSERLLKQGLE